jgi:hypothetical protein
MVTARPLDLPDFSDPPVVFCLCISTDCRRFELRISVFIGAKCVTDFL